MLVKYCAAQARGGAEDARGLVALGGIRTRAISSVVIIATDSCNASRRKTSTSRTSSECQGCDAAISWDTRELLGRA